MSSKILNEMSWKIGARWSGRVAGSVRLGHNAEDVGLEEPKALGHPDSLCVRAAQGWIELGDYVEADKELDGIAPELRSHPDVLEARWEIYARAKKWEMCLDIAERIVQVCPGRAGGWIHRSFALHELGQTQEAFDKLLPVGDKFRKIWLIPYNLACYCAQLRRLDESREWFKAAMAIDEKTVREAAIDDPDLKPLWDSMGGTSWEKCG